MNYVQQELWEDDGAPNPAIPQARPGNAGPWLRLSHTGQIVSTYRRKQRVQLSPAWWDFYRLIFTLTAFGEANLALFPSLRGAFERMLEMPEIYDPTGVGGFIPVLVGGGMVRRLDERVYRPNPNFGEAFKIETLDARREPPDVESVFREQRWLWGKLGSMPVLNITYGGWNFVQRTICV
jgi:hypothetical protein